MTRRPGLMSAPPSRDLANVLNIHEHSLIAIIGAGGKTTTMLSLASSLAKDAGILLTTTTKIWPIANFPAVIVETAAEAREQLEPCFSTSRGAVLARAVGRDGKLHGVEPEMLTALAGNIGRVILCEADGSAGRPVKVHGAGEPVVPSGSTHVLIVAGLGAVGRPASAVTVHRIERYREVTGGAIGEPITAVHLARALSAMTGFIPLGAVPYFLLNQADSASARETGAEVAAQLRALHPEGKILATSRGALVEDLSLGPSQTPAT